MKSWIRSLASSCQADKTAARSRLQPRRRFYRPGLEYLEARVTPTTNKSVFGPLTFIYTVSDTNTYAPDGALQSTILPVTVGITQLTGIANNLPVLRLAGGVTLSRGPDGILKGAPSASGQILKDANGLVSFTTTGVVTELLDGKNTQLLNSAAHTFNALNLLSSTGTQFLAGVIPIANSGTIVVTPSPVEPYIVPNGNLVIKPGGSDQETVQVGSVTSTTFTANFAKAHAGSLTIADGGTTSAADPMTTSSPQSIAAAAGVVVVTPAVMEPYIVPNASLVINQGQPDEETVTVTSATATTFAAAFTAAHPNGFTIDPASTTSAAAIAVGTGVTVTPSVMTPLIVPNAYLVINQGEPDQEVVQVSATTSTSFTANFTSDHLANATIGLAGSVPGMGLVVTPTAMEPYIVPNASLVIDHGQPDEETVTVTSVTGTSFTANFAHAHPSGFTITSNSTTTTSTVAQTISGADAFTFQNLAINGPASNPILNLFTNGSGFVADPGHTVQLSDYSGPLDSSVISAPPIPLALNKYVQISNAGPLILGPGNPDWSWSTSDKTFTFGTTIFTASSLLATYDASLNQLTMSGAGVLFLKANQGTVLRVPAALDDPTIRVDKWTIANQFLPVAIRVDQEDMIVTGETQQGDGTCILDVTRHAYGTVADQHNQDAGVVGGIYVSLGSETKSTAFNPPAVIITPGIVVTNNQLTQFGLTVLDSFPITLAHGFSITPVGMQFEYARTTDQAGTHDTFSAAGVVNVDYTAGSSSGALALGLGSIGTPGLVYKDGSLQSVTASISSVGGEGIKIGSVTLVSPSGTFSYTAGGPFTVSVSTLLELPHSTLGQLDSELTVNASGLFTITLPAGAKLPAVPYQILVGNGPYEAMVVTKQVVNGNSATLTVVRATNNAPSQDLPAQATVATCATVGGSIAFQDGAFNAISLTAGINTTLAYHGLTFTIQNLSFSYTAPDTFKLSGAAGLEFTAGGQQQSLQVTLGSGATPGLDIENGELQSLNATVTAAFNVKGLHIAINQLTIGYTKSTDEFTLDGGVGVTFAGAPKATGTTVEVATLGPLPSGFSGGATLSEYATTIDYRLLAGQKLPTSYPYVILIDNEKMEVITSTAQYLIVERGYGGTTPTTHKVEAAGQDGAPIYIYSSATTPSTNSANLSAVFGDVAGGGTDHGIVIQNGELQSMYLVANGGFSLYGLSLQATAVTIIYVRAQDELELSGGVSVALTNKFAFAASIANSTPLVIDTQTGVFSIPDGLKIAGSLQIGTFLAAAVTVAYTPDGSSFDLAVTAKVTLANRFTVDGAFSLDHGQLQSIALSYTDSTGIAIGTTGLYLTHLGGEVDNINNPSQIQVSGSIGLYGMGTAKIKGYSFITASGTFLVNADELKITGDVDLVGGLLGSGSAVVDINWSTGVYSITAQLGLFDGIVNFNGALIFDNHGNVTLKANADINVPDGVPYIGGSTLASLDFYLQVRPALPNSSSFVAAWTTISTPVGSFGIGFEFNFAGQLSVIDGPPPEAAAVASTTASPPKTFTVSSSQDSGSGSLRDALAQANTYTGQTTIQFDAGLHTITLNSPLHITTAQRVAIVGPDSSQLAITGQNLYQVFLIDSVANVTISGVEIENGKAANGGGINNSGKLLLSDDLLTGNNATGIGGGIFNSGALTLSNTTVYLNKASVLTGGIYNTGAGKLNLSNSIVADNNYTFTDHLPLTLVAPDIFGSVDTSSSGNLIGVKDGNLSGISNGSNNNSVGTLSAPINPFVYTVNATGDSGFGSGQKGDVRYCVQQANSTAQQGIAPTIQFASSMSGQTITLQNGMLELTAGTSPITIDGGGLVTISGANSSTVFHVDFGATAVLTGLTISDGQGSGGGGIYNYGTLTLSHCTVSGSHASAGGGGIVNKWHLTLISSTISDNSAYEGGGIYNDHGIMMLTNSTISDNSSSYQGAGIWNSNQLTVSDSTFSGNTAQVPYNGTAQSGGGGIFNAGVLTLSGSTFSQNSGFDGGGILNTATLTVTDSTFHGNTGASQGGGIFNSSKAAGGYTVTLAVSGSTIAGNLGGQGPGISNQSSTSLTLNNSIVAANGLANPILADISGSASGSNDLVGSGTSSFGTGLSGLTNGTNGNSVGTYLAPIDPKLGSLADNGGPTQTMALLPGSPAIGARPRSGAISVVGYDASAGASTILVDANAAFSPGENIYFDNQETQITGLTTAGFATVTLTSPIVGSIAPGDKVFVNFGGQNTQLTTVGWAASAGATTILLNGFLYFSPITIDGHSYAVNTTYSSGSSFDILTLGSSLSAGISTGDPVRVYATDQRGAIRPTAASDIGAYQNVGFTVNVNSDSGGNFATMIGELTNNSKIVTGLSSTNSLKVGMLVIGTGLPVGTTISSIGPNAGEVQLSASASLFVSGDPYPLAFGQDIGEQGDLRACVALANAEVGTGVGVSPTIQFASSLNGQTITLQKGLLELMSGSGLTTIDGAGQGITISGSSVTLFGVSTNGSNIYLSLPAGSVSSLSVGMPVTGAGIPAGETIAALLPNSNQVQLSIPDTPPVFNNLTFGTLGSVFQIDAGAEVALIGLTIRNGNTAQGGGINNAGKLTLTNDTVSNNSAGNGGGICNTGTLTLTNDTISNNSAGNGGGIYNAGTLTLSNSTLSGSSASSFGGGIFSSGPVTLTSDTLSGNSAGGGGGIYSTGALAVSDSTFSNNSAGSFGGGINNEGTLSLARSTFTGNHAFAGGGIYVYINRSLSVSNSTFAGNTAFDGGAIYSLGPVSISDSTISGNSAQSSGGGINIHRTLTLSSSTLANNSAKNGGGIYGTGISVSTLSRCTIAGNSASNSGGGIYNSGTLSLQNTIAAGNSATIAAPDILGSASGANNLIGIGAGMTGTITDGDANHNQVGSSGSPIDPGLAPLADNGGPTQTMALLSNSTALGAGALTVVAQVAYDAGAGATRILVNSPATISSGQSILIGGQQMQVTSVAQVGYSSITVSPGLSGAITAGTTVFGVTPGMSSAYDFFAGTVGYGAGAGATTILLSNNTAIVQGDSVRINGQLVQVTNVNYLATTYVSLTLSNAISASITSGSPVYVPGGADQRGAPLPASAPDIGAFQSQVFTVITNTDSAGGVGSGFTGDLRYCANLANADVAIGVSATITFAPGINGQTITLRNGPLEFTDATATTTVDGAGHGITISGLNFASLVGNTTNGSNIVTGLSSTGSLNVGMQVTGAGIPVNDTIAAIGPNAGEIQLSSPATAAVPLAFGTTVSATLPGNTTNGSNIVTGLSSTSSLNVGMLVTGAGIPTGDTIAAIGPNADEIQLSSPATAGANNVSLAFISTLLGNTTNGSTIVTGLSSLSSLSVGMLVRGVGIPVGATIAAIGPNVDEIQLSSPATATSTATVPLAIGTTGTVIQVDAGTAVVLIGLTLTNGNAAQGGGIHNEGTLTLLDCTISGNFANSGGGIFNTGALTLSNTNVNGNTSISGDQINGDGTMTGTPEVGPVTPTISYLQPVNINFGTALDDSQLHGTAIWTVGGLSIFLTGTFSYTSAEGVVLGGGNGQSEDVTFTPDDTIDFTTASAPVTVNVSRPVLTVTAFANSKTYGAIASDTGTISGEQNGDGITASFSSAGDAAGASVAGGPYLITATLSDPNNKLSNYTVVFVNDYLIVTKAAANIGVNGYHVTYNGNSHQATGSATGATGESLSGLDLSATTHTNATNGAVSDAWTFTDITGNYKNASGSVSDQIDKANANFNVNGYHVTYNGASHTATGSATGAKGESLAGLDLSGTTRTNATPGAVSDSWTFTDVTGNYNNASGSVSDQIDKANANFSVNGYHVTYNGASHTATGSATGVKGESLAGLDLSGTTRTNATAGAVSDSWTFTDVTGNFNNASGSVSDQIDKANANFSVNGYHVTYNGASQTATGSATGAKGERLAGLDLSGTTRTNATAGAMSDAWTFTDVTGNYNNVSGSVSDQIDKANVTYTIGNATQTYGSPVNLAQVLAATITTGVNSETLNISYASTGDSATAHVGSYPITGALADGSGALANYAVTLLRGTLTVNPYACSYQIANDMQVAGTPANLATDLGTSIATGVNGQALAIVYASTGNTATAAPGAYPITGTLANSTGLTSDYMVTLLPGVLTVTGAVSEILVLDPTAPGALQMSGHSVINESSWPVYVDSSSASAIQLGGNASLTASKVLDVGGYQRSGSAGFHPTPVTGSANTSDPLVNMQPPSAGSSQGAISLGGNASQTIQPGTYSQIAVTGNANLTLVPGVYVINGGGLSASGNATIQGKGVVIYFAAGSVNLGGSSTVLLTAPTSGAYNGVGIFQARTNTSTFYLSGNAYLSSGTIYAPRAALNLSGSSNLSAPLIVGQLALSGNADPSPNPPSRTGAGQETLPLELAALIRGFGDSSLPSNLANTNWQNEAMASRPHSVQMALDQFMARLSTDETASFGEEVLEAAASLQGNAINLADLENVFGSLDDLWS
jgi:hypothetical protein